MVGTGVGAFVGNGVGAFATERGVVGALVGGGVRDWVGDLVGDLDIGMIIMSSTTVSLAGLLVVGGRVGALVGTFVGGFVGALVGVSEGSDEGPSEGGSETADSPKAEVPKPSSEDGCFFLLPLPPLPFFGGAADEDESSANRTRLIWSQPLVDAACRTIVGLSFDWKRSRKERE